MVAITEEKLNEMFDHYIDLEAKKKARKSWIL